MGDRETIATEHTGAPYTSNFNAPSARLAVVTRKKNELIELINNDCEDNDLLNKIYKEYLSKVDNMWTACSLQDEFLSEEGMMIKSKWVEANQSANVNFCIMFEKYLQRSNSERTINLTLVPQGSQRSSISAKSSTSSARVRLAERTARIKQKNSIMANCLAWRLKNTKEKRNKSKWKCIIN